MENAEKQSVKDRILIFINSIGETKSSFEKRCNISNGYLNQLRNSPSLDKLSNILKSYPQLNKVWLLSGEGEMLRPLSQNTTGNISSSSVCQNNGNNVTQNAGAPTETVDALIAEMREQRLSFEKQNASTNAQIDRLLAIIENITNK